MCYKEQLKVIFLYDVVMIIMAFDSHGNHDNHDNHGNFKMIPNKRHESGEIISRKWVDGGIETRVSLLNF